MEVVNIIYSRILSRRFLMGLFIFALVALSATLVNRYIQSDDNWFGEQAYWLVHEGTVKLKSIPFIFNWDTEFLVYHKLLVWAGSLIITIFGWSVYCLKAFNLLCFFICMSMMWRYGKKEGRTFQFLLMVLILIVPMSLVKAFEFRPEVPAMMFGFGSFFFLTSYLNKDRIFNILIAGLLAALAFLTHLNGAIFCVSGFFLLLSFRKVKEVALFSAVAIPVCLLYFIPLLEGNNFAEWIHNLQNWPSHSFADAVNKNIFQTLFERISNEHKRFFWNDQVAGISVLFIMALLMKGKYLWATHRALVLYTIFQITFLALLGSHKAPRYLMLNLPYMVLVVAYTLKSLAGEKQIFSKALMVLILTAQVVLFTKWTVKIVQQNEPHAQKHHEMLSHIPRNAKVIGPWELIYNEISNYRIYSFKSYEYLEERMSEPFTQVGLTEKLLSLGIEYILIDEAMKDHKVHHWFNDWIIDAESPYQEFYRSEDYLILKKN